MEHLLLLLVRDPGLSLELISGRDPAPVMTDAGVVGIDAVILDRRAHQTGGVIPHRVVLQRIGVIPGDIAAALIRRPAIAPHHIQRCAHHAPGVPILGTQVGDYSLGKLDQRKAKEGAIRIDRPGHICGAGLPSAGAARVVGPHIAGGRDIGRSRLGRDVWGASIPRAMLGSAL